ncbi:MAG: hypothetical protein AAGF97_09230 [Planctomycetota bacterium]
MPTLELGLEPLETRRLLAGQVAVTGNAAGDIVITGDNSDNDIRLVLDQVGFASYLVVEGHNGTQIEFDGNTGNTQSIPISRQGPNFLINRDVRIQMRGGDDVVDVRAWLPVGSLTIQRDLSVNMGSGRDTFTIEGNPGTTSFVGRNLTVNATGGADGDYVEVQDMFATRVDLRVGSAGSELDQAIFRDSRAFSLRMSGTSGETELAAGGSEVVDARLTSGSGEDQLLIADSRFGRLDLNSGSVANDATLGDFIMVGSSRVDGHTVIRGGAGRTTVEMIPTSLNAATAFLGEVTINTGGGDDHVHVSNGELQVFLDDLTIDTGSGDDLVEIDGKSIFNSTSIRLGGGDDELHFEFDPVADVINGTAYRPWFQKLSLNGGGGHDTVYDFNLVILGQPLQDVSIEAFV